MVHTGGSTVEGRTSSIMRGINQTIFWQGKINTVQLEQSEYIHTRTEIGEAPTVGRLRKKMFFDTKRSTF